MGTAPASTTSRTQPLGLTVWATATRPRWATRAEDARADPTAQGHRDDLQQSGDRGSWTST
eukprot:9366403-Pyramimonas_sp.AAC.1